MNALYRAALGPLNTAYYLPVFDRFDATGRSTTTWNWAASLFTLGWMVFRQLWSPALVYVAAAEGLALLVFALGRVLLQWPQGIEWGVLATVAVLAFAVPGMYGNAMLHTDIRKRIARALAASRTVPEACDLLASQASTRRRMQLVVLGHAALVAAAALAYLLIPQDGSQRRFAMEPEVTVAQATSASAAASAPVAAGTVGTVTDAPPASDAGASAAPAGPVSAPVTTPVSAPVPEPVPAPGAAVAAPRRRRRPIVPRQRRVRPTSRKWKLFRWKTEPSHVDLHVGRLRAPASFPVFGGSASLARSPPGGALALRAARGLQFCIQPWMRASDSIASMSICSWR
jgi:hypothetical protein